jgi:DNA invertase Pin-like site-specific DNA recombinase
MIRSKNRGLVYLRRSTDKQAISLTSQLEWAIAAARKGGIALDAAVPDLTHMQALHLHAYKAIRLDDGITGADLTRPGFLSFNRDALEDASVSHAFFYKRDRFARPDDAMQASQIEKQLLFNGITVVHSDGVTPPLRRGEQNIMRDLELLFAYSQGGEELRKHAERVLGAQHKLAEGGYRVGGNAPYGHIRALVDTAGNILEELPPGKTVRQSGCHVRVVPKFPEKIAVWLQVLAWKSQGWGAKRIAKELNDRGIPSPDAGRIRTDHGVKHFVSGKWSHRTVLDLCQNATILGIQEYGKRSEGKIRRLGEDGPRVLDEQRDLTPQGRTRVIFNDPALRTKKLVGEAKFDPDQWQAIQSQIAERSRNQRGVPRAKDLARYPLACRLVDMTDGCGSILYGRTTHNRAVYTCGRYMRTAGAECSSNQVDAEAILRFTLRTLKQFIDQHGRRDKLRQKLLERALREAQVPEINPRAREVARLHSRQTELQAERANIEYRMARETDDNLYAALTRQYKAAQAELATVEEMVRRHDAAQTSSEARSPEAQTEAALALLDDFAQIMSNSGARAEVKPLVKRLGLRIGLTFRPTVKGKKRVVQKLVSGRMVFGDGALPVPLFGRKNLTDGPHHCADESPAQIEQAAQRGSTQNESTRVTARSKGTKEKRWEKTRTAGAGTFPDPAAALGNRTLSQQNSSQPEGISITKGSRGDWIRTSDLLNPILWAEIAPAAEFHKCKPSGCLRIPLITQFARIPAENQRFAHIFPAFPCPSLPTTRSEKNYHSANFVSLHPKTQSSAAVSCKSKGEDGIRRMPAGSVSVITPLCA